MRSATSTIFKVMRILANDIQSDDGVANAAISEAADRLEEQERELAVANERINRMVEAGDQMASCYEDILIDTYDKDQIAAWRKAREAKL